MNIYILPSANKNNLYIELLINYLGKKSNDLVVQQASHDNLWSVLWDIFRYHKTEKNIIHIQWSTILYGSKYAIKSIISLKANLILRLFWKAFFKTKFVWTVHNFTAHDYNHKTIDKIGRWFILFISDVIIVQQKKTLDSYRQKYPNKRIKYIPHGNYIDVYGPIIPRDYPLRESYGFEINDIVLLSFGAIKKYKLNEKIIDSVIEARKVNPKIKLLIIGKGDSDYVNGLQDLSKNEPGIVVVNSFVSNFDIPKYLSLANYSVFYYDKSEMTSGGIVLSLSYGVPVIARDIPGAEMVTIQSGILFDDESQLKEILTNLRSTSEISNSTDDIISSVKNDSWDLVASDLWDIYRNI